MEFITKKHRIYRHAEIIIKYHYFQIIKVSKIKFLDKEANKSSKI